MPSDIERKLALLDLLATRRALTVAAIFEKLPSFYSADGRETSSSKKMFERDKEDLAAMGFPLLVEVTDDGEETYRLDPPDPALPSGFALTKQESDTLSGLFANPVLHAQLPEPALQAILKLYELYSPLPSPGGVSDEEPPPNAAILSKLLAGIHKGQALEIEYGSREGKPRRRKFSPWRLILKQGKTYLLAFCHIDRKRPVAPCIQPEPSDVDCRVGISFA